LLGALKEWLALEEKKLRLKELEEIPLEL